MRISRRGGAPQLSINDTHATIDFRGVLEIIDEAVVNAQLG